MSVTTKEHIMIAFDHLTGLPRGAHVLERNYIETVDGDKIPSGKPNARPLDLSDLDGIIATEQAAFVAENSRLNQENEQMKSIIDKAKDVVALKPETDAVLEEAKQSIATAHAEMERAQEDAKNILRENDRLKEELQSIKELKPET